MFFRTVYLLVIVLVGIDCALAETLNRIVVDHHSRHPWSSDDKEVNRQWIADGARRANDPINPFKFSSNRRAGYDWWSLQRLDQPAVPKLDNDQWSINEIDSFILATLRRNKLQPSPPADARTLVRRLYVDLIGLPAPVEVIDKFVADPSLKSWQQLVGKLLSSQHYGERWARHWMDVARFGESDGYEYNRPRENSWHFRDWLIRAFNEDMPYDQFARMQLAGDILKPNTLEGVAAVGFLVAGTHNTILGVNPTMKLAARHDELEELAGAVGQAFLGMTINCARCHDHKFDPISTREYYSFIAALDGIEHGEREVPFQSEYKTQRTLRVYSVKPSNPGVMRIYNRGDVTRPGKEVAPGGIAAISNVPASFEIDKEAPDSQRRKRLAAWITQRDNALFHRVAVNRIWHYHFGRGIVTTPSDFGFNGGRPSHPQLLDWLSVWFRDNGYSMKKLHRLIVTSATYQQTSQAQPDAAKIDQTNRLLGRQNTRRIEAEVLRDSILEIAGQLNRKQFGPSYRDVTVVQVPPAFYYTPMDPVGMDFNRRTVYRWNVRGQRSALLDTFDCPDPSTNTPNRMVTTTPSQALSQWNDSFIARMSEQLAGRIQAESEEDTGQQVTLAWRYVLSRSPSAHENKKAVRLVRDHGLPLLCRVLFNSNEFILVD